VALSPLFSETKKGNRVLRLYSLFMVCKQAGTGPELTIGVSTSTIVNSNRVRCVVVRFPVRVSELIKQGSLPSPRFFSV